MSERTEQNISAEAKMGLLLLVVVAAIAFPIAFSFLRNELSVVAFFIQATPFILIASAIGGLLYSAKVDKS
ncbi:hypothetical protein MHM98_02170 [Psychrobium sp. MM17-31]|uniref:hypothetical protein n=1 Tax=Psychrobium sp. MM17-31 TaxID=2917758 RepID=UPI001EF3F926|nr:hypothetical protein [Psychrobium sp. MM17-31]MCG7530171.1 hypothetical protein [Psychrobium sp. MM17-31]